MFKGAVLLLIFMCLNYSSEYKILLDTTYDLDSDTLYTHYYSNDIYDYYVIGNSLEGHTHISLELIPITHVMDAYYVSSKIFFDDYNIGSYIDRFYRMCTDLYPNYSCSHSYSLDSDYPYMFFAFHATGSGEVRFQFRSYYTSAFAAIFIVLIIVGVLLIGAGISMSIAKCMGRNAWEGLACFCIMCTLCCCRR